MKATREQWIEAAEAVHEIREPRTDGEVFTILDAISNGESPDDCLEEYRFWRSPGGIREEVQQLHDSAHPLSDVVSIR